MKFFVTGRVHPERADVFFSTETWTAPDGATISVSCNSSQLGVWINIPTDDAVSAFNSAQHVAEALVSSLGFDLGTSYWVEMIQITAEDGTPNVVGTRPGGLHFEPDQRVFPICAELSRHDVLFRLALRDYATAIRDPLDCATYCFRAIEAIKYACETKSGITGWAAMHASLGTNRETIDTTVKEFADPVRHGNWINAKPTTIAQRHAMLSVTRDVLARYINFCGNQIIIRQPVASEGNEVAA